jgi:protein Tex
VHQDGLVHVSAMSRNFVANPREVVKPGDIVRVKVLSVDLGRKRISLTMRLDNDFERDGAGSGPPPQSGSGQANRGGRGQRGGGRAGGRGGDQRENGGGAMAEALRRAGLAGRANGEGADRRR